MRTVSIRLSDMGKTNIPIGFVGENLYTQVRIDSKKVFDDYPTAIASLTIVNPHGDVYPGFITRDDDVVVWTVNNSDLVYGGNGKIQLAFLVDDVVAKSYECRTYVSKALVSPTNIPTPIASWIDAANVVLGEAEEVFEALDEMTVAAETLTAGSSATAEISDVDGHKHIAFGIPKGDKGDQGNPGVDGSDGYSPTLVVSTITGGHRITITDKNGTSTVDIMDGEKGDTGATGNGISSVVLNQDYTLTINYTNGQSYTTTSIRGAKGDTGATGATGATPVISIGTVTTGDPDDPASATMDTTDPAHPVLSMVIPQGQPGSVPIDDTTTASDKVWSSEKVDSELTAQKSAKAPVILDNASGEIVTVPDGADGMLVEQMVVGIEPVQDLHGQDAPYPPGGGKNLFDFIVRSANGITTTKVDGKAVITGTASAKAYPVDFVAKILPAGTYVWTISGLATGVSGSYTKNGSWAGTIRQGETFTLTEEASISGYVSVESGTANLNITVAIMLESGSAATAWSPYSNICPISGWTGANVTRTGKNLLDCTATGEESDFVYHASNVTKEKNKITYQANGTLAVVRLYRKLKAGTYTFNASISASDSGYAEAQVYKDDSEIGRTVPKTFTLTEDTIVNFRFVGSNATSSTRSVEFSNIQLELGSTASEYVPSNGSSTSYPFPDSAGTVYGGTLTVNSDGTGQLVVDRAIADLGNVNWTADSNRPGVFYGGIVGRKDSSLLGACSDYHTKNDYVETNVDFYISGAVSYGGWSVFVRDTRYASSTAIQFKTAVIGVKVIYELATYVTYQLTNQQVIALLKGSNNIWADCGNTSIEYPCDTKLFIERLTAPTEDDMIANANIASGRFFMVGNNLYISTSAIAQGETITPGTNCTAVSLADALNQINQ